MGQAETLFAVALVGLMGLLIIPVSIHLLDVLIVLNMGLALVILLLSVSIRRAIDFSAFPTLLLFVTMFRLALHVSSTRLILTQGQAFNGVMIRSFGSFVAGENAIVGMVVFSILVIIQYLIITKGSERVAEVAARFRLDALPVRLMALDSAAQGAGANQEEIAQKRLDVQLETDFYGSMDGASRFVRGENVASILIVLINIVGGLSLGFSRTGGALSELVSSTVLLTVGDGLVNLIPSLVISLSMGIVITKTAQTSALSTELMAQIVQQPRVLVLASGFLSFLLAIFSVGAGTGAPAAVVGSILLGLLAWWLYRGIQDAAVAETERETSRDCLDLSEGLMDPTLRLTVGLAVENILAEESCSLTAITGAARRAAADELGLLAPEIRISVKPSMAPGGYTLSLRGVEVGAGEIVADHRLCLVPPDNMDGISLRGFDPRSRGKRTSTALWIRNDRARALDLGVDLLVRSGSYLQAHLVDLIRQHADEILGLEELKATLNCLRQHSPASAEEIGPGQIPSSTVHAVLKLLLAEGVSIRNLPGIVGSLSAHHLRLENDPEALLEPVRQSLSTQISRFLADESGAIRALVLDPAMEADLLVDLSSGEGRLSLSPERARVLLSQFTEGVDKLCGMGQKPVLAVHPRLRLHLKRLFAKYLPDLTVIAFAEVARNYRITPVRIGERRRVRREVRA